MLLTFSHEWETPPEVFEPLDEEFHFTLDPCASDSNHKCALYFTAEQDGLAQDWGAHRVFMNPPYREIGKWLAKAVDAAKKGALVVALTAARTETRAWWDNVETAAAEIRFINGRVRYVVNGQRQAAAWPSVIIIFPPGLVERRAIGIWRPRPA